MVVIALILAAFIFMFLGLVLQDGYLLAEARAMLQRRRYYCKGCKQRILQSEIEAENNNPLASERE